MQQRGYGLWLLAWLCMPVLPAQRPAAAAVGPEQALRQAVAEAEALGVRTGVLCATDQGRILYGCRSQETFVPASNQKLLTAAVVLQGLGPEYRFRTRFLLRGGKLVVEASGDPNWITGSAQQPAVIFGQFAQALRQRGIQAVQAVVLDPGSFLGASRPPAWPQDQLHAYYCAPTGPFVLDQGVFTLSISAGRGAVASVNLVGPTAAVPLRGSIEVVEGGKDPIYGGIDRGDTVQLSGKFLRKSPPVTVRSSVRDPADWYRAALLAALAQAGITVSAAAPAGGPAAADGLVYEHSTELGPALLRMLEESSNFDAEQCLRVLGAKAGDGSLQGGVAAMQALLVRELGALPADVVLADGSGLSKTNRLSPQVLLQVLLATQRGPGANLLRQTLPIAGQSGTLAERFLGSDLVGRVHAKTGWIRGASALSGYVGLRDGSRRWFVILMNYDPNKNGLNKDLKQLQERMVAAIENLPAGR